MIRPVARFVIGLMNTATLPSYSPKAAMGPVEPAARRYMILSVDRILSPVAASLAPEGLLRLVALQRDRAAFGTLFGLFAPKVRAYALRMGAFNASAEELVQEVMLSVWRRADTYDPDKANAATWIYVIARNRLLDEFRRLPPLTVQLVMADKEAGDDPAHELRLDSQRAAERLRMALGKLPAEQSEVLRIAYYEGLSQRDMALRLGLPLGTVKSRTRLALDRLRDVLKAEP